MTSISEFVLNYVVNASWQMAVVVIVAAAASYVLRNGPARPRHALWFATLALSVIVPLFAAPRPIPAEKSLSTSSPANTIASAEADQPVTYLTRRRVQVVSTTSTTTLWLFVGYVLLVAWRVIRLVRFWVKKERLRRSANQDGLASAASLASPVERVAQRCRTVLGVGNVFVAQSKIARVPYTIGARKPLIVLPVAFCVADEDRLLAVIGHEVAHVARHDYVTNLIAELVALPIAFHPLTFFIKRQIDRERELACDELVSKHLLPPQLYARSLVWAADMSSQVQSQAFVLSMFEARTLEERIMRLTRNRKVWRARTARISALLTLVALCATTVALSLFSFELKTQARAAFAALPRIENPTETTAAATTAAVETLPAEQSRAERPLNAPTAQARAEAACDAGHRGDVEKIPTLVAMLGDDTQTELLHCWDNGRWSPALETFKHPSPGEQAAIALASMGPSAFPALTNQLDNSNATVRRNAAWAIGELTRMSPGERDSAVPQLITLLGDSDEWVRMAAARALGELRNDTAVPKLIATLSDSEWRVRELAVWALSELKDDRAVAALCNVLLSDAQVEVRRGAAEALGEIRSAAALPSLKQALNDAAVSARAQWAIDEIEG